MAQFFSRFSGKLQIIITLCLSGFLLLLVFYPKYSEIFAVLLLLVGFSSVIGIRGRQQGANLEFYEKLMLGTFAMYGLVSIISFLYWPFTRESHMRVEDDLKFLVCIFLYLSLRRYEFNVMWFVAMMFLVVLLMGLVSLGQYGGYIDMFTQGTDRPSGSVNPMRYAAVALIFLCFVANSWFMEGLKGSFIKLLLILVVCMGLAACVLTQTRGVWLAIPLLGLLYGGYAYKKAGKGYFIAILFGGGLLVGLFSQADFVQKRIDMTVNNFVKYQGGNGNSSLGTRLDMYKASLILAKEKPFFGHGLGVFRDKSRELKNSGVLGQKVRAEVGVRKTPHNEFFQALVERGLFGLAITILLFAVPGFIFYRAVKSGSEKITYYGLCGLSMLTVFFVAGQTGTLFNHNLFTNLYIIMVLLFVSQIRVEEKKAGLVGG